MRSMKSISTVETMQALPETGYSSCDTHMHFAILQALYKSSVR